MSDLAPVLLASPDPLPGQIYVLIFSFGAALFVLTYHALRSITEFVRRTRELDEDVMTESRFIQAAYPAIRTLSTPFRGSSAAIVERYRSMFRDMVVTAGLGDDLDGDDVFGFMLLAGGLAVLPAIYFAYFMSGFFQGLGIQVSTGLFMTTCIVGGFLGGAGLAVLWIAERRKKRQRLIRRSLPYALDLLTLSVEAGLDFTAALNRIAQKQRDTPLAREFRQVTREIRMGKLRSEALRDMADRAQVDDLVSVVSALCQADELGSPLGPILKIQAEEIRTRRFQKAEKLAMEAPVKLLFPLIFLIMPQVFAIIFAPLLLKVLSEGLW